MEIASFLPYLRRGQRHGFNTFGKFMENTVDLEMKPLALMTAIVLSVMLDTSITTHTTALETSRHASEIPVEVFNRVATYDVPGTVAEIVASTPDGEMLIYTDSVSQEIGFVTITDPQHPTRAGSLAVPGEPTSVAVTPDGAWALAVVHGSSQDVLVVVDLKTRAIHSTIALGGQPDSIAISADGRYAAVAIENERDEDVNDGAMPQSPPGFLTIIDLVDAPSAWTRRDVALTGLAERFPDDPEPEYISINASNQVAVTLQENNHIVIVDLASGTVVRHWSAGTTTHLADTAEDNDIQFVNQIVNSRREPDAIAWTPGGRLITANEGDYDVDLEEGEFVGGRDLTVFSNTGAVQFEPGAALELEAVRHGHYPDERSEAKGIEPEGVAIATYHDGTSPLCRLGARQFRGCVPIRRRDRPHVRADSSDGRRSRRPVARFHNAGLFVTANEKTAPFPFSRVGQDRCPRATHRSSPMVYPGAHCPGRRQARATLYTRSRTMCSRPAASGRLKSGALPR